jgi:hypothetical protein
MCHGQDELHRSLWRRCPKQTLPTHCLTQPSALLAGPVALPIFEVQELLVLRQEVGVLRRQVNRPKVRPEERIVLSMLQRLRSAKERMSSLVIPDTLRWHRELVRRKWTRPHRVSPRRIISLQTQLLVWRISKENRCGLPPHPRRAAQDWHPDLGIEYPTGHSFKVETRSEARHLEPVHEEPGSVNRGLRSVHR